METNRDTFSASPSVLGYLYQVRYALLKALEDLRKEQEFTVSIETLDDIVFDKTGSPRELLQSKHHLKKTANLTDSSLDLWKTIRVWCEAITQHKIPEGALFFLITTAQATDGSAAHYLKAFETRNPEKAMQHLNSTAESSTNQSNAAAYQAYRSLSLEQRRQLLDSTYILDGAGDIQDLDTRLKENVYFAAERRYLDAFLQRLEGWWYRRVVKQLLGNANPILSQELDDEMTSLREQFKQDSLPIDEDIMTATVDASGYQDHLFVHQLRMIEVGNVRIFFAIRDYFRAFEQRSRWVREELLLVGELDHYEERLVEEWEYYFQQMKDEIGEDAAEKAKKAAAQALYKWVETGTHLQIRPGVTEPSIARGTYHILSDAQRVGWHLEFKKRLRKLLEGAEVAP